MDIEHTGELIERYWERWDLEGDPDLTTEIIFQQYRNAQPHIERMKRLRKGRQLNNRKKILPFLVMWEISQLEEASRQDIIDGTGLKPSQVDSQLRILLKNEQIKKRFRDSYFMTPEQKASLADIRAMMTEAKEYRSKPFYFAEHRTPNMLAMLKNDSEQDRKDWEAFMQMRPTDRLGNLKPWDKRTAERFAWDHPIYDQIVLFTEEYDESLGNVFVKTVLWEWTKPAPRLKKKDSPQAVYTEFRKKRKKTR